MSRKFDGVTAELKRKPEKPDTVNGNRAEALKLLAIAKKRDEGKVAVRIDSKTIILRRV